MPQQGSSWVVDSGDNVFKIAEQVYGNQRMAFEILKMNGGSTLIHPGDVLSLPEWNDPNVYVGANQMQNVIDQNIAHPEWGYTGPTVAAVPDSQRADFESSLGITPPGSAPIIPSVQQRFRSADAASMAGAPQGSTAVQAPNIPSSPRLTQSSTPSRFYPSSQSPYGYTPGSWWSVPVGKSFDQGNLVPIPKNINPEVERAQRYQASGVPGSAFANQPAPPKDNSKAVSSISEAWKNIYNMSTGIGPISTQMYWNGKTWVTKGMEPAPMVPSARATGTATPSKPTGTTRFQSLLMEDKMRPELTAPEWVIPSRVSKGLSITMEQAGYDPNYISYLLAPVEDKGAGYVYDKMTGLFYPAGKVPGNGSFESMVNIPEYDWNRSHEPSSGNYGYGGGGGGGGGGEYIRGGGGVNSGSVASYSLSTRLATG